MGDDTLALGIAGTTSNGDVDQRTHPTFAPSTPFPGTQSRTAVERRAVELATKGNERLATSDSVDSAGNLAPTSPTYEHLFLPTRDVAR